MTKASTSTTADHMQLTLPKAPPLIKSSGWRGFRFQKIIYGLQVVPRAHSRHRSCPPGCPGVAIARTIEGAAFESRYISRRTDGALTYENTADYYVVEILLADNTRLIDIGDMVGQGLLPAEIELGLEASFVRSAHPTIRALHAKYIVTGKADGVLMRSRQSTTNTNVTVYQPAIGKLQVATPRPLTNDVEALRALIAVGKNRSLLNEL